MSDDAVAADGVASVRIVFGIGHPNAKELVEMMRAYAEERRSRGLRTMAGHVPAR